MLLPHLGTAACWCWIIRVWGSRVRVPSATGIIRRCCLSPTKWAVDIGFTLALLVHTLTKCCWHSKVNSEDVCSALYVVLYGRLQTGNHGLLFKDALAFCERLIWWVQRGVYGLWGVCCSLGHKLSDTRCLAMQFLCNVEHGCSACVFVRLQLIMVIANLLTPNDHYSGRTAPLTSKRCISYIYSTNIGTEYFKHGIYSQFFSSSKRSLFHNSNVFGSFIIHILYTECAKIKEIIPAPKS